MPRTQQKLERNHERHDSLKEWQQPACGAANDRYPARMIRSFESADMSGSGAAKLLARNCDSTNAMNAEFADSNDFQVAAFHGGPAC